MVRALPAPSGRRIVCSLLTANRHAAHLEVSAPLLAGCFDDFVIGCYREDLRGYPGDDPAAAMLALCTERLSAAGVDPARVTTLADPGEAVSAAFASARPGDLLVVLAEAADTLPVVERYRTGLSGSETPPPRR